MTVAARSPLVWVSGAPWDGVEGTDRRMVSALARAGRDVVWIEPPGVHRAFASSRARAAAPMPGVEVVSRNVLPGFSRPVVRRNTARRVRRFIAESTEPLPSGAPVVVASPHAVLPDRPDLTRVLFLTDDWIAGASLMRLDVRTVTATIRANLVRADVVLAVSSELLVRAERMWEAVHASGRRPAFAVLPNGVALPLADDDEPRTSARGAILVGQLNERTDLALVEEVARRGVALTVVGPLTTRDEEFRARWRALDQAFANIDWIGRVPVASVGPLLYSAKVGLTPYTLTPFNVASSPLKTLEYLAAGLPVVSSALPASKAIGAPAVVCASTPAEFGQCVVDAVTRDDPRISDACRATASGHSWDARTAAMLALVG